MIEDVVREFAAEMGLELSKISIEDGAPLGCLDAQVLSITKSGHTVSALIYQTDLNNVQNGIREELLELKLKSALSRLKMLLEP